MLYECSESEIVQVSTKYVYVRKHTHKKDSQATECFASVMKISLQDCSVKYVILQ